MIAFSGSEDRRGFMEEEEEWQTAMLFFFDTARKPGGGEGARRMRRMGKSRCLLAWLFDASAENQKYKRSAECPHTLGGGKI